MHLRGLRFVGLLVVFAALCLQALPVLAANPAPVNFALRPGGKAQIKVFAFCLDQPKKFPTNAEVRPAGPADQKLRQGLAYIVDKNYDQSQFQQAMFALWYLKDNKWYNKQGQNTTIAQEIVNAAANTPAPGAGQGTALQDAQANGTVDAVVRNFSPVSGNPDPNNNYFGAGTLEVVNKTNSDQQLYLAFGTTFPAPNPDYQSIIVYGTEIMSAEGPVQAAPSQMPRTGDSSFTVLPALLAVGGLTIFGIGFALRKGNAR